ncbi:MAG: 30S ribosomal protein S20 [Candidatus Omnitrophica bacterium]|nr:30S ribosomal protein S20 [Candidatus Omnitrophota bacterium]MBI3010860.1 30S ribosomal protein S20 [Candidatus Omnitrophota bacterium]
MPIKHAALKQLRKDARRNSRNQAARSRLRTLSKRFLELVKNRQSQEAAVLLRTLSKEFDHAAAKRIIHANAAARHKSRMSVKLNQLSSGTRTQ